MEILKLKSARAKVLAVASWLRANARYQNQSITEPESIETAIHFNYKLNVHDVRRLRFVDDDGESYKYAYSFRIKVGNPKFRGSVNYTLNEHSILFLTSNPTYIRVVEDYTFPDYMPLLCQTAMGVESDEPNLWLNNNCYSAHPHVSEHNEPCLGGWAQAWSACIATSNLPSLVPVAQSFLNTWTSNDAYYDINHLYRSYRHLPLHFRKMMPIGESMSHTHIWYKILRDGSNRRNFSHYKFCRWVAANEDMINVLIYDYGFSFDKLYNCFNGVFTSRVIVEDTESTTKRKMFNAMDIIMSYYRTSFNQVTNTLGSPPDRFVEGLVTETMIDFAGEYVPEPWSNMTVNTWIGQVNDFYDFIHSKLNRERQALERRSDTTKIELSHILEYSRYIKTGKAYQNIIHMTDADMENAVAYYIHNSNGRKYRNHLFIALNRILDSLGYEHFKIDFELSDARFVPAVMNALLALDNAQPTVEQINEYATRNTYKVLCNYENKLTSIITGRIQNGKDKHRPVISNSSFGNDAQQSQLSLESF